MKINNITYTKTSFKKRWSQIVNDHGVGDKLVTSNLKFIQGAIKISSKWKKIGYSSDFQAKISSIEFGPNGKQRKVKGVAIKAFGIRSFIFISQMDIINDLFLDNTELTLKKKNRAETLIMMRQVVSEQIKEFKNKWEEKLVRLKKEDLFLFNEACKCPISGNNLLTVDVAIDHDIPFINLASEFWRINGIDPYTVLITGSTFNRSFEDENMTLAWIEYHREHAKLQAVDSVANLKKNKKSTEDYLKSMADSSEFIRKNRLGLKGL